jgi:hypothetical protein
VVGVNSTVAEAVANHRVLSFWYEDLPRSVEPHLYGIHAETGNEILSAYQTGGTSHSSDRPGWRYFLVSEIRALSMTNTVFGQTRPGYNRSDPHMKIIYARA